MSKVEYSVEAAIKHLTENAIPGIVGLAAEMVEKGDAQWERDEDQASVFALVTNEAQPGAMVVVYLDDRGGLGDFETSDEFMHIASLRDDENCWACGYAPRSNHESGVCPAL